MPKIVPDYSQCKIYKLVSPQTDKVYIGSTCSKYLSSRLAQHKDCYKRYLNGKYSYISSYEIVKYDDCKIVLIQSYTDCQNSMEQRMFEQDYIDIFDCVNKQRAYISLEQRKERDCKNKKEWRKNNKEKLQEYDKEYYQNNKEKKKNIVKNIVKNIIKIIKKNF
jgi:hypothetical protein